MAFITGMPTSVPKRERNRVSYGVTALRCNAGSPGHHVTRRDFAGLLHAAVLSVVLPSKEAKAVSGLHIFPLTEQLTNNYYLMRAAESIADSRGEARSHPLDLMSVGISGLTRRGVEQTRKAAEALRSTGVEFDAWIWPGIATSSMETAEVLANELSIRRERINPEFSFLDARGLGVLDGKPWNEVMAELRKMDMVDIRAKPPPHDDGTPNESAEQVFVKVRQLISKIETQYFGENILIIAPDSQPLSILQAAMMDFDALGKHHDFAFGPAEVRKVVPRVISPIDGKVQEVGKTEVMFKYA